MSWVPGQWCGLPRDCPDFDLLQYWFKCQIEVIRILVSVPVEGFSPCFILADTSSDTF